MPTKKLMVLLTDRLSELLRKGELIDRYYNPGRAFDEVHFLLVNDDRPDPAALRDAVGGVPVTVRNLPAGRGLFLRSFGWRPRLLRGWARPAVAWAGEVRPDLVRCHGPSLNAYLAREIKRAWGVPYVLSLHGHPDVDYYRGRLATTWARKIRGVAEESVEIDAVRHADGVVAVYSPILSYFEKHGVRNGTVIHNVVGLGVRPKGDYAPRDGKARLVCVGRQQTMQKDPSVIIEALADLPDAELTLVGDGDLHDRLVALAAAKGLADRVRFVRAMPNAAVLRLIEASDVYVYSSINHEISKSTMEAALAGLPVIVDDRGGAPADELRQSPFVLVPRTVEGFQNAIRRVMTDGGWREKLGRAARDYAVARWDPAVVENAWKNLYERLARPWPTIPGAPDQRTLS